MKKKSLQKVLAVVLLTSTIFAVTACTGEDENEIATVENEEEQEFVTETVQRGDVAYSEEVRLVSKQGNQQDLSFGIDGRIISIYVNKGMEVSKGQLLAEVSIDRAEDDIKEAESRLETEKLQLKHLNEQLQVELDTADALYHYEYIDKLYIQKYDQEIQNIKDRYSNQIESLEDAIYLDEFKVEEYKKEIKDATIYAPFDGMIVSVSDTMDGTLSQAGKKIVTIADASEVFLSSTDLKYKDYFEDGVSVPARSGIGDAQVNFEVIPYKISEWSETMTFQIFGEQPDLTIGSGAYIDLPLSEVKDVLCINNAAIHSAEDFHYVYMEDENGMRMMQKVEIGLRGNELTEIKSGLSEGQTVIVQ